MLSMLHAETWEWPGNKASVLWYGYGHWNGVGMACMGMHGTEF